MKTTKLILMVSLCGLILSGCTRKEEDKPASVNLSFPKQMTSLKNGTLSNMILGHLVINVSGPGIQSPIVASFDRCHDCTTVVAAPNVVTVDVPQGDGRLFQVLAVYMDDESKEMDFFYGDKMANISGTEVQVPITVSSLGGGATISSGNISGRILNDSGTGPSGDVLIKYYADGKPGLIIEKSVMAAGWFSFFGLRGASLRYEMADGTPLFGGQNISLDSAIFNPTSQVMRVTLPQFQRVETYSQFSSSLRLSEPEVFVFGFWGPGAAGKPVCYESMTGPLTKVLRADQTSVAGTPLTFAAHDIAPPTNLFAVIDNVFHQGGVASSTAVCSEAPAYSGKISVIGSQFNGEGKDASSGMKVPFRLFTSGSSSSPQSMLVVPVQGAFRFSGQLLPGVSQILSRIEFFKYVGPEANNFKFQDGDRGFPCFEAANKGFVPAGGGSFDADGNFQVTSGALVTDANNSQLGVGFCLITNSGQMVAKGGYLPPHSFYYSENPNFGSTTTTTMPIGALSEANNFSVYTYPNMGWSQCHPIDIQLVRDNGVNGIIHNVNSSSEVAFSIHPSGGLMTSEVFPSSDPTCSGTPLDLNTAVDYTLAAGATYSRIYLKKAGSAMQSGPVDISATFSGNVNPIMHQANIIGNTAAPFQNIRFNSGGSLTTASTDCRELSVYFLDSNMTPTSMDSDGSAWGVSGSSTPDVVQFAFTDILGSPISAPAGVSLVNNCTDLTPITSRTLAVGSLHTMVSLKMTSSSAANFRLKAILDTDTATAREDHLFVNVSPVAHHLAVSIVNQGVLFGSDCNELQITARDVANNPVTLGPVGIRELGIRANSNFNLQMYPSSDCMTGGANYQKLNIANGSSTSLYLKGPVALVQNFTIYTDFSPFVVNNSTAPLNATMNFDPGFYNSSIVGWFDDPISNSSWSRKSIGPTNYGSTITLTGSATAASTGTSPNVNYLTFSGTNSMGASIASISNYTVSMLIKKVNNTANDNGTKRIFSLGSLDYFNLFDPSTGNDTVSFKALTPSAYAPLPLPSWYVMTIRRSASGASSAVFETWLNGVSVGPDSASCNGSPPSCSLDHTNFLIGYDGTYNSFQGGVAEVLLLNSAVSNSEQSEIYNYFRIKYPALALPAPP